MIKNRIYALGITLLLCFMQVAGLSIYAQEPVTTAKDTLITNTPDTLQLSTLIEQEVLTDTLIREIVDTKLTTDSLDNVNQENLKKLEANTSPVRMDSIPPSPIEKKIWIPDPTRATWLAVVFPGGGQIYNRKYWKLPLIYGGFAGCAYALNWNNNMYKDYSQAYVDIMDKDPNTSSYYDLLPPNITVNEETDTKYGPLLKKRKDYYRRYRDISVFAFIGVYLLSIVDAYVDAELSNFDITPDISMRVEPTLINNDNKYSIRYSNNPTKNNAIGLQCSIRF